MSKKHDSYAKVRIDPDTKMFILRYQNSMKPAASFTSVANYLIRKGYAELMNESKPST